MRVCRVHRGERGAILVFSAIVLVVLIGMAALAVDIGQMYIAKQRAQSVCDATALAGAWELAVNYNDVDLAKTEALAAADANAATNNGLTPTWQVLDADGGAPGVDVIFPAGTVTTDAGASIPVEDGEAIQTTGFVDVDFAFAGVLGFPPRSIRASATAIVIIPCLDIVPLAFADSSIEGDEDTPPIQFGDLYELHAGSWDEGFIGPGNYLSLRFEGDSGANDYRERLAGGSDLICMPLDPGSVETEPGLKGPATYNGLADRLRQEKDEDFLYPDVDGETAWLNWLSQEENGFYPDTKRIIIMPIIRDEEATIPGSKPVEVVGLAAFFIREVYERDVRDSTTGEIIHDRGDIEGYFIQGIAIGSEMRWIFRRGEPESLYFIHGIRLIS